MLQDVFEAIAMFFSSASRRWPARLAAIWGRVLKIWLYCGPWQSLCPPSIVRASGPFFSIFSPFIITLHNHLEDIWPTIYFVGD